MIYGIYDEFTEEKKKQLKTSSECDYGMIIKEGQFSHLCLGLTEILKWKAVKYMFNYQRTEGCMLHLGSCLT